MVDCSWADRTLTPSIRVEESTTAVGDTKSYTNKYCTIIHNHLQPKATTILANEYTRNGTQPSCKVLDRFVEAFGSSAQHQLKPSKTSAGIASEITTFNYNIYDNCFKIGDCWLSQSYVVTDHWSHLIGSVSCTSPARSHCSATLAPATTPKKDRAKCASFDLSGPKKWSTTSLARRWLKPVSVLNPWLKKATSSGDCDLMLWIHGEEIG